MRLRFAAPVAALALSLAACGPRPVDFPTLA
jgi:predicted small lipoprotein YifL